MIILASGSPRRIELLASLGLEFLVRPAAVDETIDPATPPDEAVAELSRRKASHVYRTAASPDDTVIAADTLVCRTAACSASPPTPPTPRRCCAPCPAAAIRCTPA